MAQLNRGGSIGREDEIKMAREMRAAQKKAAAKALQCRPAIKLLEQLAEELKSSRSKSSRLLEAAFENKGRLGRKTLKALTRLIRRARKRPSASTAEKLASLKLSPALIRLITHETRVMLQQKAQSLKEKYQTLPPRLSARLKHLEESARAIAAEEARANQARNQLAKAHYKLAVTIARRHSQNGIEADDLIQEATIGLLRGTERYNPDMGCHFSTYLTPWITHYVTRATAEQKGTIRTPAHTMELSAKIGRASLKLLRADGDLTDIARLARETGIRQEKVVAIMKRQWLTSSLDNPLNEDGDGEILYQMVKDRSAPDPYEITARNEQTALLETLKDKAELDENEKAVLQRFAEDQRLDQRDSRIKAAAIRKLRRAAKGMEHR